MSPSRRRFLAELAGAGGALVAAPALTAATAGAQERFRGRRASEERTIDGIAFCWCPPGSFVMGSPPEEIGHRADEAQVQVTLSKGFWTGKIEVTQGQWARVAGAYPERPPTQQFGIGDDVPVYWVSFLDAERFCASLTQRARRSGALPQDWEIRLPTEAQWEYACRAGTRTASAFGATLRLAHANFAGEAADMPIDVRERGSSKRAGSYAANALGIHDRHGNVWEWCRDWYHSRLPGGVDPDLYESTGVANRDGTHSRVRRGGAWIEPGWACRSACRLRFEPPRRSDHIGFRVVAVER